MNNVRIILTKELRSYFDSPVAYIFIVIFLLLSGTYFVGTLFLQNVSSLQTFFESAPVLLLFFAPAITMRLISEEKHLGTFEIVQTNPIGMGEFVVGKFLAAWVLLFVALVPTLVFVVTVASLGSLDGGPLIGGYLGLLLLGGTFIAIGTLGSTTSDNQIIALIFSFVLAVVLFALDKILLYVPTALAPTVEYLSVGQHFSSLARGVIDSRDVLYYISAIILFVMLATVLAARESSESVWRFRTSRVARQIPKFALVAVILVFVNLLSLGFFKRIDLTANKVYTLSDATKGVLSTLDDDFLVTAYFSPELPPPYNLHRRAVQEMLDEYRAYSHRRLHYQFVNPKSDPTLEQAALQAGVTPVHVKVVRNDKFQTEKAYVGLAFSYLDRTDVLPAVSTLERLEYDLTSSMREMITGQTHTVGFLTGQGEPGVQKMQTLWQSLSKHHRLTTVTLAGGKQIPLGVTALVAAAPRRTFSETEKFTLDQFIMGGGRVAFFLDRMIADPVSRTAFPLDLGLNEMFDTYGWIINPDLVADSRCVSLSVSDSSQGMAVTREVTSPFYPVAAEFNPESEVVKNLGPIAFAYVSSIDPRLASIRGATAEILVSSSAQSKVFTGEQINIDPEQSFAPESFTDRHVPLAVAFRGSFKSEYAKRPEAAPEGASVLPKSPPTRIVVVGDGEFVFDENIRGHQNVAFVANVLDWLFDDAGLMAIRTRDITPKPLSEVGESTKTFVKYSNFIGPLAIVIAAGLVRMAVKARRRKKHKNSY
jgi:ABC-2 type transport system permease protein